ncbi:unnamed protein product [Cylicostephanus goldi]|uniref:Uncharacterized protein n=1 Tax=Cylicostephanus goldi TaxID=71465 RepID=A0A3P6SKM9_CYLGO|nr:unnamed protein product [Cylicostephanus goldi]
MDTPKTTIPDPLVEEAIPVIKALEKLVKNRILILNAIPRAINYWQKTYHANLHEKKQIDLEVNTVLSTRLGTGSLSTSL